MKTIIKKSLCIIMAVIISAFAPTALAVEISEKPLEITSNSDLVRFFSRGGKAILKRDIIYNDAGDMTLSKSLNPEHIIDMNGFNIRLTASSFYILNGARLTLVNSFNGKRGAMSVKTSSKQISLTGTLAVKDAEIELSDGESSIYNGGNLIYSGDFNIIGAIRNHGRVIYFNKKPPIDNVLGDTLKINLDGGSLTNDEFAEFVSSQKDFTPTRDGYEFDGFVDAGNNKVTDLFSLKGEKEVKATWLSPYTVTFDADGGTCSQKSLRCISGNKLEYLPTAEKENYCFDGWLAGDKKVTLSTAFNENTTVKAKWVVESEKANDLEKVMKDVGFSQKKIDEVKSSLYTGEDSEITATMFSSPSMTIMVIGLCAVIILLLITLIVVKRKNKKDK